MPEKKKSILTPKKDKKPLLDVKKNYGLTTMSNESDYVAPDKPDEMHKHRQFGAGGRSLGFRDESEANYIMEGVRSILKGAGFQGDPRDINLPVENKKQSSIAPSNEETDLMLSDAAKGSKVRKKSLLSRDKR